MSQDRDEAVLEFMEEIVDDLGYTPRRGKNQPPWRSFDFRLGPKFLVACGMGILVLIAIVAVSFTKGIEVSREDFESIQAGLDRLDKKMAGLEGLEERIALIESGRKELVRPVKEVDSPGLNNKERRASSLNKKVYHKVRSGQSLYIIAKKYGISVGKLCKLNGITLNKPIRPGQKLLVGP